MYVLATFYDWTLRFSSQYLLCVPKYRTSTFGKRSFSTDVSKLWNTLALDIITSSSLGVLKQDVTPIYLNYSYNIIIHGIIFI